MPIRVIALLLLVVAIGCASAPAPDPTARIVLERAERPGYWRAVYETVSPVEFLCFQRPAAFYRESVWEVVTPGWRLDRLGDRQTLEAEPGAATARVVVEFPVYTEVLPKEYEFFREFTDGSIAVYTGHLYVSPTDGTCPENDGDEAFVRRIGLRPAAGEQLVVQGVVSGQEMVWDDPHGDGTYAYFGSIAPLETEAMVAILDPGAPGWLVERIRALLPELFETYTARFGEPLPWKPVVLFNFVDVEMSGRSSGGGTLTGLIQLSAEGRDWSEATPETAEGLLYLVAHEAVHLWNGQLHGYEDPNDSWMHEGSADAFAGLMLFRSDYIDAGRLAERRTEALNECILGLRDGPLVESSQRRQFGNYYACGEIVAAWSVAAVSRPSDHERLFDIWRVLFERTTPPDGRYDRETYFEALTSLGVDEGATRDLREFLDAEHVDPSAALAAFLARVGIETSPLERHPPTLRRVLGAGALTHLMADACGGRVSYYTEGRRLRTEPIDDCEPFARPLRIVSIAGHPLAPDGDRALAETTALCRLGRPVVLGLEDGGEVEVPCASPPDPPPAPRGFPRL